MPRQWRCTHARPRRLVRHHLLLDKSLLSVAKGGSKLQSKHCVLFVLRLKCHVPAQLYDPPADWDAIARLVAAVSIPVLGNGDVFEVMTLLRSGRLSTNTFGWSRNISRAPIRAFTPAGPGSLSMVELSPGPVVAESNSRSQT